MASVENVQRIEPARLERIPEIIADVVAEISARSAELGGALHPLTAANLAGLVRIMNSYYSNLIEGHNTRPGDIERALAGDLHGDEKYRNLHLEAAAHVRVQATIDRMAASGELPEPASVDFILWLHEQFYLGVPEALLYVEHAGGMIRMAPGTFRSTSGDDVAVGRHIPPSSERVRNFMRYFERRYRFVDLGKAGRITAMAAAHHRLNYIHPFLDGNGRVSRLMSHGMAQVAGIGAHGLWSVSRGLARGLQSRTDYNRMMDHADMPRRSDTDGRGNLSESALEEFVLWFLRVCLDQITFMTSLFELDALQKRLRLYVERSERLRPEAAALLEQALIRGQFERGETARITGLPERTARRVINETIDEGLLASESPKGPVSLRFPTRTLEVLFPRLYQES